MPKETKKALLFETCDSGRRVKLTKKNAETAEAEIMALSRYQRAYDPSAAPILQEATGGFKGYRGSTAYWGAVLKDNLLPGKKPAHDLNLAIWYFLSAVNRDNTTHLRKADKTEINKKLFENKDNLLNWLKNPRKTNYAIIRLIGERTEATGRRNLSFASKFAHYAAAYVFRGKKEEDNFSVYDSRLRRVLPAYCEAYGIKTDPLAGNYPAYQKAIDELREAAAKETGELLTRRELDHLLWFYHNNL